MHEFLIQEEKRLCQKFGVANIKQVIELQKNILNEHYHQNNTERYMLNLRPKYYTKQ